MKVLVMMPDAGQYGGTIRFLEQLLDIHAQQGIVTTLLVPSNQCHTVLDSIALRYGVVLVRLPNRVTQDTPPFLTPLYDLLFSWRTVVELRPDLIVVSTGDPGRFSILLYFPVPVLYILHSVPEKRFRLLPRLYLWLGSMLKNNCVMTVSNAAAESVSHIMGIPRPRIEVVYNSCGAAVYRNESDRPIVLTVGHLVAYKNPEIWFEVARKVLMDFPDSVFVWLGDGELLESFREKVKSAALEERILLPGYVSDPSMWYARSHIYFQPSLRESHGIAVLEAMAHGLPCVVANSGGLPESVVDGETGYVCQPDNSTDYRVQISTLLNDGVLRKRMGRAGQKRVETYFSAEVQEQRILAIYGRFVNRQTGRNF